MDTTPRDLDALLAQAGWAKALARSLVRDPDRAEDLVQRAWLAALRNPPDEATPPRRWLAAVMRNFVRDDAREATSRERREREVARPDRAPDPFDDAASAQARLLAAVRELSEPSRSAVWARYYEGLPPREIAQRDGVPVDTVKTRIARGLDALRKKFDRDHGGDRGAWTAALLPLAFGVDHATPLAPAPLASAPLATTLTTLAMDAKIKIAAALALVVCGSGVWLATQADGISPDAGALAAAVSPTDVSAEREAPVAAVGHDPAARVAVETPTVAKPPAPVVVAAAPARDGVVVDLERRPVAGLAILDGESKPILVDGKPAESDARGRFRIDGVGHGYVRAQGEGWTTVYATPDLVKDSEGEMCVVVSRHRSVSGSVVDAGGAPVANALVGQRVAESVRRGLGELMRGPIELACETRTDAHGRFTIAEAPDSDATITAQAQNHHDGKQTVGPGSVDGLVITLPGPGENAIALRGRVVDVAGAGVARATVCVGQGTAWTDGEGRFELSISHDMLDLVQRTTREPVPPTGPAPIVLRAVKEHYLPASLVLPALEELERIAPREEYVLRLGGPPLEIHGRVVDSQGEPVARAEIGVLDEDDLGLVEMEFSGMNLRGQLSVERFLRGGFSAAPITTATDGSFTVPGLQAREYRLNVVAKSIPASRETEAIRAGGKDVVIALDTQGRRSKVAGRVVDKRGETLAGVQVELESSVDGGRSYLAGATKITDASGAFQFESVRGERFRFELSGSTVVRSKVEAREGEALEELVLQAARRAFVQVDLGESPTVAADAARFLDVQGNEVQLDMSRMSSSGETSTMVTWVTGKLTLAEGKSEVGSTSEGEYTCVLEKDGKEVARIPASLGGKGVTVVRP